MLVDLTSVVNREQALWDWLKQVEIRDKKRMPLFDFLRGVVGSTGIAMVDDVIRKSYVNGDCIKAYTFACQIMLPLSDHNDNINTKNMHIMRVWQKAVHALGAVGKWPDFGPNCSDYGLDPMRAAPTLTQLHENHLAKYAFFATLTYLEKEENKNDT